jgi:hypothetical protein
MEREVHGDGETRRDFLALAGAQSAMSSPHNFRGTVHNTTITFQRRITFTFVNMVRFMIRIFIAT